MKKDYKLILDSHTSDGGIVEFTPGNSSEVTIHVKSKSHFGKPKEWKVRTDARVYIGELIEVLEALKGIYKTNLTREREGR